MGYRNDVLFVLKRDDKIAKEINRYELWISNEGAGSVKKRLDEAFDKVSEEAEWFEWFLSSSKWYSGVGYEDVGWVETLMDWLDSESLEDYYQFIRIGENLEDNESRGWFCAYQIVRRLERFD